MLYPAPKYKIGDEEFELLSMQEYKERINQPDLSTPTLAYKIENDELDYIKLGSYRYIIFNQKARAMKVLNRRPKMKRS